MDDAEHRKILAMLPYYERAIKSGLPFPKTRRVVFVKNKPATLLVSSGSVNGEVVYCARPRLPAFFVRGIRLLGRQNLSRRGETDFGLPPGTDDEQPWTGSGTLSLMACH